MRGDSSRRPKDLVLLAANYAHDKRAGLEVFLSDSGIPIDTNCGRCASSPWGGATGCSAGRSPARSMWGHPEPHCHLPPPGVDPRTWLVDVLQRVASHPAKGMAQLTPQLWKDRFAANPMTSDIDKGQAASTQRLAA